jgi:hypothetical protein
MSCILKDSGYYSVIRDAMRLAKDVSSGISGGVRKFLQGMPLSKTKKSAPHIMHNI